MEQIHQVKKKLEGEIGNKVGAFTIQTIFILGFCEFIIVYFFEIFLFSSGRFIL